MNRKQKYIRKIVRDQLEVAMMEEKAKIYLAREYKMLQEYSDQFGVTSSIVKMKMDKINGACAVLQSIGLLTYRDIVEVRDKSLK